MPAEMRAIKPANVFLVGIQELPKLVSACATPAWWRPSADDLRVEAKPPLTVAVLSSEKAHKEYDAALEAWGERHARRVGRLCRQAKKTGQKLPFACPLPPPDS